MPIYSMSTYDAEFYLKAVGIPTPDCPTAPTWPQYQMLQVNWNDQAKEDKESRSRLNGACFQYEIGEDKWFLDAEPKVVMANKEEDQVSTVIMFDPDCPTRKGKDVAGDKGVYLHWCVTGCKKTAKSGASTVAYEGPNPPAGKHRYIFVEFVHTGKGDVVVPDDASARGGWDIKSFITANRIGKKDASLKAIAMNFCYVSKGQDAALGKPGRPRKNGTACDKPWYPQNPDWSDDPNDDE